MSGVRKVKFQNSETLDLLLNVNFDLLKFDPTTISHKNDIYCIAYDKSWRQKLQKMYTDKNNILFKVHL